MTNPLRVCVVGGIFDVPEARRWQQACEVTLSRGLRERGVDVTTSGHRSFVPSDDCDVVHVHHMGRAALVMATSAASPRFVYSSHDGRIINGYRVSRRRMAATRFVAHRADAVVAMGDYDRRRTESLVGGIAGRTAVIPNGFDPARFFPAATPPRADRVPRLLFVGQLIPLKGIDVLLEAARRLAAGRAFELVLVSQNGRHEPRYRELAQRLGVADRVRFAGFVGIENLGDVYRSSDLLVLPSYAEALSSVVIEAMMCGLPIVASNLPTIAEQVGEYGHLAEPGDVPGLVDALGRALDDRRAGRIDAAAISRRATRLYGAEAMVEGHLALYRELLARGGAPERSNRRYRVTNLGTRIVMDAVGRRLAGRGLLAS